MDVKRSTVASPGGADLAVFERGAPGDDNRTILCVHGWPDCHEVWDLVADRLAAAGDHVVTFDVRGVGASTPATVRRPYRITEMAADIDAVIAATSPARPVHLVGHDWGGAEGWEYAMSEASNGRVATYTTLSGPNLDHLAHVLRHDRRAARIQIPKSLYTLFLSLPVLRTAVWRLGAARLFRRWLRRTEGLDSANGFPGPGLAQHATAGVPLYRTNIFGRLRTPPIRPVHVPVHQLVSTEDRYVDARVLATSASFVGDFTRREIRAGHWSPRSHPDLVAGAIAAFLDDRDPVRN